MRRTIALATDTAQVRHVQDRNVSSVLVLPLSARQAKFRIGQVRCASGGTSAGEFLARLFGSSNSLPRDLLLSPFVLITGTVITLILLMGGSVSLLYAIDSYELPSILMGGVAGGVRKE